MDRRTITRAAAGTLGDHKVNVINTVRMVKAIAER